MEAVDTETIFLWATPAYHYDKKQTNISKAEICFIANAEARNP